MIIALGTADTELRRIVQEVLLTRHTTDELRTHPTPVTVGIELLGRSAVEHQARQRSIQALQHIPHARLSIGLSRGVEMTPAGTFVVCAAVVRAPTGREATGWNTPRQIPDSIAQSLVGGGDFVKLVRTYRQNWRLVDTVTVAELEELLNCRFSYTEALNAALDAVEQ